jgi:hypothetical protein
LAPSARKKILGVIETTTYDYSRRIVKMTPKQIARVRRKLIAFPALFNGCFGRRDARELLCAHVEGQRSNVHRRTAEAIALRFKMARRLA